MLNLVYSAYTTQRITQLHVHVVSMHIHIQFICLTYRYKTSAIMNIDTHSFICMYFLVIDYEMKHVRAIIKEIKWWRESFLLRVTGLYSADQRINNKNTEVAVINIYCNYLQQNGELILNVLQNNSNNL